MKTSRDIWGWLIIIGALIMLIAGSYGALWAVTR